MWEQCKESWWAYPLQTLPMSLPLSLCWLSGTHGWDCADSPHSRNLAAKQDWLDEIVQAAPCIDTLDTRMCFASSDVGGPEKTLACKHSAVVNPNKLTQKMKLWGTTNKPVWTFMTQYPIFLLGVQNLYWIFYVLNILILHWLVKPDRHPLILWVLSCFQYRINFHTNLLSLQRDKRQAQSNDFLQPFFKRWNLINDDVLSPSVRWDTLHCKVYS